MDHLEALSLAESRDLDPAKAAALRAHLDACASCAAVHAAWPAQASAPDLWPALRRRILPAPRWAPQWLTPLATGLSVALLLSAFWRPEQAWVRADQSWAYGASAEELRP